MRILQVHDHYLPWGGAEVYFTDIINSLEERGLEIAVLYSAMKDNGYKSSRRKEYFIPPSPGLLRGLSLIKEVRKIVDEVNPDIIHIHGFHGYTSPLVIREMIRMRPTIHTAHDIMAFCLNRKKIYNPEDNICKRPVGWGCLTSGCIGFSEKGSIISTLKNIIIQNTEMRQYRKLIKIIVASKYMRDELVRNGVSIENIEILYYYLNVENDWFDWREKEEKSNIILYVGRIEKNKGVGELIDILSLIQDIQWRAKIIGYGSYECEARKKIDAVGLSSKIDLVGHIQHSNLSQYYNEAAVVVVPSIYPEPFGLIGIEAMYFGKPVVAFDVGGISEWLKDGENGFLVKFPDKKQFAERIKLLLEDSSLAEKFGRNGKEMVKRFINKDEHVDRLLKIYNNVIEEWKYRK